MKRFLLYVKYVEDTIYELACSSVACRKISPNKGLFRYATKGCLTQFVPEEQHGVMQLDLENPED
jgi:hypothetical protein